MKDITRNGMQVLERRYLVRTEEGYESPEDLFHRVAEAIGGEERADEFYEVLSNLEFLPNSPTLMNAGRTLGQLAACFVISIEDNMGSIFDAVKNAALIHKSGGGTGFSFSRLRPKGSEVATSNGVASGPVSFMGVINAATEAVKQGGTRRGANMGILRVDHPDIIHFVTSKIQGGLENFNISVAITDEFMEAVSAGTYFHFKNPRTGEEDGGIEAVKLFSLITECAWKNGEPGIVFIDRINQSHPLPDIIESTNPCVAGNTWVHTQQGPCKVLDLLGTPFNARIDGHDYRTGQQGFFKTAIKKIFRLNTREGYELRLTEDHPVKCVKSMNRHGISTVWRKAGELKPGEKIVLNDHRNSWNWPGKGNTGEGYLIGLLVGNGTLKMDKAVISVWEEEGYEGIMEYALDASKMLSHRSDFAGWMKVSGRKEHRLVLGRVKALALELGISQGNKIITETMEKCSSEFYAGFLRGFFDADGSVQVSQSKGVSIRLAQSDIQTLKAVQRMLLRLGIVSRLYSNRRRDGTSLLPDGKGGKKEYPTLSQHELAISGENMARFRDVIGFSHTGKAQKLENTLSTYKRKLNRERFTAVMESLVPEATETVYDVQVPGANVFDANGIKVHNCGEQPLLPNESCNLGSINLSVMVKEGEVNWKRLREVTATAVRFLDRVIDINKYPLPEIKENTLRNRKIGLGVMGWADMLAQLKIPYNSDEAVSLAEQLMKTIDDTGKEESIKLAEELGSFPSYPESNYDTPMRNATVTTIAPTGTISIIAGCCSGIEPLFAISYKRKNVLDDEEMVEVNQYFIRDARAAGIYTDALAKKIAESGSIENITEIPKELRDIYVTSLDIDPKWHVRHQAAFQKYTDNAVSKTINLPNEAKVDDVENAYRLAYQLGCKGVTIYRDGSRESQVLATRKEKKEEGKIVPQDRPTTLSGITDKIKTGYGNLYVTINTLDGKPFEVFAQIGKSGYSTMADTEAICRLISLALRSGIAVDKIIEQLYGIGGSSPVFQEGGLVMSIPDAIGQILKNHFKLEGNHNHDKDIMWEPCPDCGERLEHGSGCISCSNCGYSRC